MNQRLSRRDLLCRLGVGAGAFAVGDSLPSRGPIARAAATPAVERTPGVREYWIAARNVRWAVSPSRRDGWKGRRVRNVAFDALSYVATEPGFGRALPPGGIGDNTVIPGPVLRGSPGDTLVVHFRNEDRRHKMAHTIHPHGVRYAPEHDGTYMGRFTPPGGRVGVGQTHTYRWEVVEDSVGVWPYHDHGPHEMHSTDAGLFGAIVIRPRDEPPPSSESTIYFHQLNPAVTRRPVSLSVINGRAYAGNTPTPRAKVGQDVVFNVLTLGSEFHTFHIHGHRWQDPDRSSVDAPALGPSQGLRARFRETSAGRWLYHCHVMSHMEHGMVGYFLVDP